MRENGDLAFLGCKPEPAQRGDRGGWSAVVIIALDADSVAVEVRAKTSQILPVERRREEWPDRHLHDNQCHQGGDEHTRTRRPNPGKWRGEDHGADERDAGK